MKALITGICGQDGSYLMELLLRKGYEVHGIITSKQRDNPNTRWRIRKFESEITLHQCELLEYEAVRTTLKDIEPDEVYHLASDVSPRVVLEEEILTFEINFLPVINLLHAAKSVGREYRLYCAGSSLMFGEVQESPQNESTPMNPTTPYGIAKVASYQFIRMHRQVYGTFACMGILYNHESPRRDNRFLPKKISKAVSLIKAGKQDVIRLGDIDIKRDWSFAGDIVESMWLMLQKAEPMDYVIGSGRLHSIRELLEIAFRHVGLDWRDYVVIDDSLKRSVEYLNLCADSRLARNELDWRPKMEFIDLVERMVEEDLKRVEGEE